MAHSPFSRNRHEGMMWLSIHDLMDSSDIKVWDHLERASTLSVRVTQSEWNRIWPTLQNVENMQKREELFAESAHRAAKVFVSVFNQEIART